MSRDHERSLERASLLYQLLTEEGVYDADDFVDRPTQRNMVVQAVGDLVTKAEEYYRTQKSQITRHIGQAAFLHSYLAGEDEEGLTSVVAELGWSRGRTRDFDGLAISSLTAYPRLLRKIEAAKETPPEPTLAEMEVSARGLDDSIITAIEEGRIPRSYGGLLRLYMGTVEAPATVQPAVLDAAYSQAGGKLRVDIARRAKLNDMTPELAKGFALFERFSTSHDIAAIAQDEYPAARKSQAGLTEAIRRVETLMALALDELYK